MIKSKIKTFSCYTLGCKLNFSETSTISRDLIQNGYKKIKFGEFSDIVIINTCSVTENAEKECKIIIKRAIKINSQVFIIVIGCYAQLNPSKISQIPGVDLILGTKEKFTISKYLNSLEKNKITKIHVVDIQKSNLYVDSYSIDDYRTRAFLKIQDGCDYKCTYCTIPLARGVSRSSSLDSVIRNAVQISNKGIKEIVLTGVNIGDYGRRNKNHENDTFLILMSKLDEINGIKRIRISSIEPNLLKDDIIYQVANSKKFVPHFHIPLQSGSNVILKKMQRRYLIEFYSKRINQIKKIIPDACIGVDVIVGFPGETEELFLETYHYLNSLDISYIHVFTYSARDNTEANYFSQSIPLTIRKERNKMLRILSEKKKFQFYLSQIGTSKVVLWERTNKNGMMYGYTENYIRIKTQFNYNKINLLETVVLENFDKEDNLSYLISS